MSIRVERSNDPGSTTRRAGQVNCNQLVAPSSDEGGSAMAAPVRKHFAVALASSWSSHSKGATR